MSLTGYSWAFKRMFQGIFEAKRMFLLALLLAGFTLSIPLFLGTLGWSLSTPIRSVPMVKEITVFPERTVSTEFVKSVAKKIKQSSIANDVRVIEKAEALQMVNKSLGIATRAKTNPLPDLIIVTCSSTTSTREIRALASAIEKMKHIESVAYDDSWVKNINALFHALAYLIAILTAIVLALVFFVISASVRLTTTAQRDEIRALHLFGAYDRFIKRPYVWRGTLTMILSALISIGISYAGIELLKNPVADFAMLYNVQVTLSMCPWLWYVWYVLILGFLGFLISLALATSQLRNG